jgi:hypothetical protein
MSFRGKLLKYSKKIKWGTHVCVEIAFKGGQSEWIFSDLFKNRIIRFSL